jgi:hypothetical protein
MPYPTLTTKGANQVFAVLNIEIVYNELGFYETKATTEQLNNLRHRRLTNLCHQILQTAIKAL